MVKPKTNIKKLKKIPKVVNNVINYNVQAIPFCKDKGQHILKNPGIVNSIVSKAALKPTDIVMEVGSGTGNLSVKLMENAKKLIAFEIDTRMIAELKKRIIGTPLQHKLSVVAGDVIKHKEWPFFDVCVANLPYQISSPFIFRLLAQKPLPRYAVLMFQKEFAERLIAKPGSKLYCRLSVTVQLLSKVEHLMRVKRTEFRPPPKVDSAVIRIEPRNPPPPINYMEWDGMLRLAFLRKSKTLLSIFKQKQVLNVLLKNFMTVNNKKNREVSSDFSIRDYIENLLINSGFNNKRARNLSVEDFLQLLINFNEADIHFA